ANVRTMPAAERTVLDGATRKANTPKRRLEENRSAKATVKVAMWPARDTKDSLRAVRLTKSAAAAQITPKTIQAARMDKGRAVSTGPPNVPSVIRRIRYVVYD